VVSGFFFFLLFPRPNLTYFQLQHSVLAPLQQRRDKFERVCTITNIPISNDSEVVFKLRQLSGNIAFTSLPFKTVTDEKTKTSNFFAPPPAAFEVRATPYSAWL